MAFFDWDYSLSTSIGAIDDQHKKLIGFVNSLHEAMLNRKGKEVIGTILEELSKYTDYHFSTEEKAFDKFSYPDKDAHKKSHADLIKQLGEVKLKHQHGQLAVSVDVLNFLINWVKNHIMREDMLYVPFLKGKDIG